MAIAAGTRLGSCEIVAPLGAGGMGEVCTARDPCLGRVVALGQPVPSALPSPMEAVIGREMAHVYRSALEQLASRTRRALAQVRRSLSDRV